MSGGSCAICCALFGTDGMFADVIDGKRVWICTRCKDEHPRTGRYSFTERNPRTHTKSARKDGTS